jgi:hypothetical protein
VSQFCTEESSECIRSGLHQLQTLAAFAYDDTQQQ